MSEGVANRQGVVMPPDDVGDASSAMDDLFKEQLGRDPTALDDTPDRDRDKLTDAEIKTASEIPELEEPAAADAAAADAAAADAADAKPKKDGEEAGDSKPKKSFLDDLLPDDDDVTPTGDDQGDAKPKTDEDEGEADPYENQKLRSDASEKTKETFEKLKQTARERENAAKAEATKLKSTVEELQKEAATLREQTTSLPEDIQSELEELRAYRLAHDTENDPTFREKFDTRREANENTIYDILRRGGLKDAVLEQLKSLSYEERVEHITRWADKLSPREKLLINSRLGDNESIELERSRALEETKANASKILSERKGPSSEEQQQVFVKEVVTTLKPVLPNVPILHPKEIPSTASPKEKEALEAHNAKAAEYQGQLLNFLQDQTPSTKGVLALAGILAPHYRAQLQATQAQLKAAQAELAKIKNAGKLSRLGTGSASPKGNGTAPLFDMNADEALDEMWKSMNPTD
jgi:hypothetical protein